MVSAEVAAEELSTPLEVKVYYINSSKIYFTALQQRKTNIVEDESSKTSACTVREEIEVTKMLQLFRCMIICHHIYDLFKSPSQSSVMNAHSTLKVIHIDAYYGSVCECLTTIMD